VPVTTTTAVSGSVPRTARRGDPSRLRNPGFLKSRDPFWSSLDEAPVGRQGRASRLVLAARRNI